MHTPNTKKSDSCPWGFHYYRSSHSQIFFKIGVLKTFPILTGLFLIKLLAFRPVILSKKETPTQMLSCEYCKIFKNSFLFHIKLPVVPVNFNTFFKTAFLKKPYEPTIIWKVYEHMKICRTSKLSESLAQRWSVKKVFLEILQNSKENTCAIVSLLIKLCFPVNFAKFIRASFLTIHLRWLLQNFN